MNTEQRRVTLMGGGIQWLILDAASCAEPLWYARGAGAPLQSLFRQQDEDLVDSGPWLIRVDGHPDVMDTCLQKDPLGHASLWCASALDQKELVSQLRARVYAELPRGETTRFRWYDPRVLFPYLEDSTQPRRDDFVAPFERLVHADLNPFNHRHQYQSWQRPEAGAGFINRPLPFTEEI
ncbi:DUF4123 domain-containing protein [Marinobacter sp.]|uniref:DUF4123 domain-containing protein n=1 Tax=Marinobacter sp. TaxID=50741 RepID=UPI001B765E9D|nr:DUF4123 domain-containing protein [Marinobacter sp.]MBQ0831770.1 DUF4123 domain-containing protein [Marinobacter sp.]